MQKKDTKQWFSELNVDMEKIFEITRHILYMYDILKTYDEKDQIKEILSKIVKPKLASSSTSTQQQQPHHHQQQQQQQRPTASNTAQQHEMN